MAVLNRIILARFAHKSRVQRLVALSAAAINLDAVKAKCVKVLNITGIIHLLLQLFMSFCLFYPGNTPLPLYFAVVASGVVGLVACYIFKAMRN